jgi:hypothetical protein
MARTNSNGKHIISAGEVGSYVVCPEAWRLSNLNPQTPQTKQSKKIKDGNDLHVEWDKQIEQLRYFSTSIRLTIILLVISVSFVIVKLFFK